MKAMHLHVRRTRASVCSVVCLLMAGRVPAQTDSMAGMPGMKKPTASAKKPAPATQKTERGGMNMSSSIDLLDPMSQEASGTAWLPASSPMYGKMSMQPNGNMLMLHGAVMPRYTDIGSKRGDSRFDAPNWAMGMFSHPLDSRSQLGLRGMFSLDPITEGGYGYPLLYQTGESWHGKPLHDRQHPHDLVDELAASYSRKVGDGKSVSLYVGYPGEPALGPPTYMHRLLAYDLADAPIGHHWQDATHITFGVATVGLNFGSRFKVESSVFTGREPDEDRYSFDRPRFDSRSVRLSFNPNPDNAFQISHGFIKNAEGDGLDQYRLTASWLYNKPLGEDSNFTTALVWGQNDLDTEGKTNSYLAEADYQRSKDTFFARVENIQKSGHELQLPEEALHDRNFNLGACTVGYVRDLKHGTGIDTGLGFAVTADTHPTALNSDYGSGTPLSFQIYLRLRPSRIKNMSMQGMDMSSDMPTASGVVSPPTPTQSSMPGMDKPKAAPTPVTVSEITAAFAPGTPKARHGNVLTVTVMGSDGKPLAGAAITASVAMTEMDMGTSHPIFQDMGDGRYQSDVMFSMQGPWRIALIVTAPQGGTPVTKTLDYTVAR